MAGEQTTGLETRNIFLDTQVYRAYGHNLGAATLKVLAEYIAEDIFILHTTDITLREVSVQLDAMQSELETQANRSARLLDRWNKRLRYNHDHLAVPAQLNLPVSPTKAYQNFETTLLYDWNVKRHNAANLTMGPVLDQYFLRRAPFDKDGSKEFPDAMALLALEAWCEQANEKCYVVSKDKAVQRASDQSQHLIAIGSLDGLLSQLTSAQNHNITSEVETALSEPPLLHVLEGIFPENMIHFGGIYDGDRLDGEVHDINFEALVEISSVTVLRVDEDKVACVLGIKIKVSADISFDDISDAIWDSEDGRYFGVETGWAEVEDVVPIKIFVELVRHGNDFELEDFQFITRDLTISDYHSDGYPYK